MPQTGQAALAASDISNNGWSCAPYVIFATFFFLIGGGIRLLE